MLELVAVVLFVAGTASANLAGSAKLEAPAAPDNLTLQHARQVGLREIIADEKQAAATS